MNASKCVLTSCLNLIGRGRLSTGAPRPLQADAFTREKRAESSRCGPIMPSSKTALAGNLENQYPDPRYPGPRKKLQDGRRRPDRSNHHPSVHVTEGLKNRVKRREILGP